jgi:sugar phosphate isomerase/epimerase
MYPWRTPGGAELKAYIPGWDPTELDYDDLTLDLSHASTANQQSIDLMRSWGGRLRHVHLTDGTGSAKDEHLVPGRGDQQAGRVLQYLAERDFAGNIVLEVNSRKSTTRAQREAGPGRVVGLREASSGGSSSGLVRGRWDWSG